MEYAHAIQTITSREFVHNVSAAKRSAASGSTVIITDRGEPAFALLNIAEYRRLTKTGKNIFDMLALPEAAAYDHVEFEPVRIEAQELDA